MAKLAPDPFPILGFDSMEISPGEEAERVAPVRPTLCPIPGLRLRPSDPPPKVPTLIPAPLLVLVPGPVIDPDPGPAGVCKGFFTVNAAREIDSEAFVNTSVSGDEDVPKLLLRTESDGTTEEKDVL